MEDALARKERLKALKAAAQAKEGGGQDQDGAAAADEAPEKPVLKFRNYAVQDTKRIDYEQVPGATHWALACA
jgi:coiled-coil domain-containing protein 12